MTRYFFNTETQEFPRYSGDIKLMFLEWSDSDPAPHPWVEVEEVVPPSPGINKVLIYGIPEKIDNRYIMKFEERDMTETEIDNKRAMDEKTAILLSLTPESPSQGLF
jgi:hypothetical protein